MDLQNPIGTDATATNTGNRDGLWAAVIGAGIRWSIFAAGLFLIVNFLTGSLMKFFEEYQLRLPTSTRMIIDIAQWVEDYSLPTAAVIAVLAALDATVLWKLDSPRLSKVWRELWSGWVLVSFALFFAYAVASIIYPLLKLAEGLGRR